MKHAHGGYGCPARERSVLVIWSCQVLVGPDSVLVGLFTLYQNGNKTTVLLLNFSLMRHKYHAKYITTILYCKSRASSLNGIVLTLCW